MILNQIGRRPTEELHAKGGRHRLLLMLDEFPALERLDFFESPLAFMAGYGLKSFLIAESLNQIEKAYGPNNSILDNSHVRVCFPTNDKRAAKRVSDAVGTATELRAMKNYAGHRLSPWLGHLMVSRQETVRSLLTPGEIMQLPPDDELVLLSDCRPTRAKKARYYEDRRLTERLMAPPKPTPERRSSWGAPMTGAGCHHLCKTPERRSRLKPLHRVILMARKCRLLANACVGWISRPCQRNRCRNSRSRRINLTMKQRVPSS